MVGYYGGHHDPNYKVGIYSTCTVTSILNESVTFNPLNNTHI